MQDEELERDFNPEEFDKKMNDIFNDEFYSREENLDPNFDIEENEGNEEEDFIVRFFFFLQEIMNI